MLPARPLRDAVSAPPPAAVGRRRLLSLKSTEDAALRGFPALQGPLVSPPSRAPGAPGAPACRKYVPTALWTGINNSICGLRPHSGETADRTPQIAEKSGSRLRCAPRECSCYKQDDRALCGPYGRAQCPLGRTRFVTSHCGPAYFFLCRNHRPDPRTPDDRRNDSRGQLCQC
jgi:hypothetical protein